MISCRVQKFKSCEVEKFKSSGVEKSKLSNSQTFKLYNYLHFLTCLSAHLLIYWLLVTSLSFADSLKTAPFFVNGRKIEVVANEVIVKFKPKISPTIRASAHFAIGGQSKGFSETFHAEKVNVPEGKDLQTVIDTYKKNSDVEWAEPNYVRYPYLTPNDPSFGSQFHLNNTGQIVIDNYTGQSKSGTSGADIKITQAWNITTGNPNVIVAVIDTGVQVPCTRAECGDMAISTTNGHPDLVRNLWINSGEIADNGIDDDGNGYIDDVYGYNVTFNSAKDISSSNYPDPVDTYGHGTEVSGCIAAATNNGQLGAGISGGNFATVPVSSGCALMAVRAGQSNFSDYDIAKAIEYAVKQSIRESKRMVINMSLGGQTPSNISQDAVNYARANNVVVVAASGNEEFNSVGFPAAYPTVIAVGATDNRDRRVYFSNYGTALDLMAPGEYIFTTETFPTASSFGHHDGTSFASPIVAGVAALLLSKDTTLKVEEVDQILKKTADDLETSGWDIYTGWGRVNAYKALSLGRSAITQYPAVAKSMPNPFYPVKDSYVVLRFSPTFDSKDVEVRIFNLAGELVRTLNTVSQGTAPDEGIAIWDGKNDDGQNIASGIYLYSVSGSGAGQKLTGKLTLIR